LALPITYDYLEHLTFVVNGAPEITQRAIDLHEHLVQLPTPLRHSAPGVLTYNSTTARIISGELLKYRNGLGIRGGMLRNGDSQFLV
jgi:hypothetical protein